jgi:Rieske Fe-S protein
MSIFNVDYKANQVKDPSAHQFMAMQQDEIAKKTQQQVQTVQPAEKSEAEVKIRDRKKDREQSGDGKKKRGERGTVADDETAQNADSSSGGFNFLA